MKLEFGIMVSTLRYLRAEANVSNVRHQSRIFVQ